MSGAGAGIGAWRESADGPLIVHLPIRWGDLDAQGHVNNAAVVDYLQDARCWQMLDGGDAHLLDDGLVVVRNHVSYLHPIAYSDEPIEVVIAPVRVAGATIVYGYVVRSGGVECAHARTALCPFDFDLGQPRKLTAEERAWFSERVHPLAVLPKLATPKLSGRGVVTPLWVRWGDVDRYGHVNNVRFYEYFQEARIAATTALDPDTARVGSAGASDDLWLVARQDVDYIGQMRQRFTPYRTYTAPVHLGRTSMVLASEIVDPEAGGAVVARGRTVLVRADRDARPVPLAESTRRAFGRALVIG